MHVGNGLWWTKKPVRIFLGEDSLDDANLLYETPCQMAIGLSYVTAIWFHSGCLS